MKKIIVSVLVLAVIIAAAYVLTNKTPSKDGEAVIFKTNSSEVNTSEYYELLKEFYEADYTYQRFEKDLLSSFEKSLELKETALKEVDKLNEQFDGGEEAERNKDNVILTLQSLGYSGYDELNLYFENYLYRLEHINTFAFENVDTYFADYQANAKPRYVSHILITVEDIANVSEAETNTMNNIRQRIVDGEDFAVLAKEFSVDSTKENGGLLPLVDANSELVAPFLSAALELETGELSEWVQTEYGFHLISVDTSSAEALKKDASLFPKMLQSTPQISIDAMKVLFDEANVVFSDKTIEAAIMSQFTTKGQE